MTARHASIDIGSNTALLLVVEPSADGWRTVEDHLEMPRIARGLDASGELDTASVARARDALAGYRARLDALGIPAERTVATGTAPFRRASNGPAVAGALAEVLGVPIDVVSGEHEAALSVLATTTSFPELDPLVVVDIGGASTELTWVRGGAAATGHSLDIGSVRLHERCVRDDPPSGQDGEALRAAIEAAFDALPSTPSGETTLVGIAGTVTTAAAMTLGLTDGYDAERVHGCTLTRADVSVLETRLRMASVAERREFAGLAAERADVIWAGVVLLGALMDRLECAACRVSDRGTRWGRLYEVFGDGRSSDRRGSR